jgi:hypothetical protein
MERRPNFERLQAGAATGILDLDDAVDRRRSEPGRVGQEGDWANGTAVALERLQAGAPFFWHSWLYRNPLRLFVPE